MSEREIAYRKYKREYIPTSMASDDTCYLCVLTGDQIEIMSNLLNYAHDRKAWVDEVIDSERYYLPSDEDFDTIQDVIDDLEFRLMSKCDFVTLDDENGRVGINRPVPEEAIDAVSDDGYRLMDADGDRGLIIDPGAISLIADDSITLDATSVYVDGITFPATQVPSADANTLDDYEEGEVVVTLVCGTGGTITLKAASDTLAYTRVGRLVCCTGRLIVDSVSSPVGTLTLSGLPFVVASGEQFYAAGATRCNVLVSTAVTQMCVSVTPATSTARIDRFSAGAILGSIAAEVQADSVFIFSLLYMTV